MWLLPVSASRRAARNHCLYSWTAGRKAGIGRRSLAGTMRPVLAASGPGGCLLYTLGSGRGRGRPIDHVPT